MPGRRYVEEIGSAAILAAKRLAGVAPEVNLREHLTCSLYQASIRSTSGRYASYWNAILLANNFFCQLRALHHGWPRIHNLCGDNNPCCIFPYSSVIRYVHGTL